MSCKRFTEADIREAIIRMRDCGLLNCFLQPTSDGLDGLPAPDIPLICSCAGASAGYNATVGGYVLPNSGIVYNIPLDQGQVYKFYDTTEEDSPEYVLYYNTSLMHWVLVGPELSDERTFCELLAYLNTAAYSIPTETVTTTSAFNAPYQVSFATGAIPLPFVPNEYSLLRINGLLYVHTTGSNFIRLTGAIGLVSVASGSTVEDL